MKKYAIALLAGVAALGLTTAGFAADLIIDEPAQVGVVDASGDWDGVYVGAFLGYAWGDATEHDFVVGDIPYDLSGWLAGVNIGADFTVTDGIVAGVVADLAWAGIEDDFELIDVQWTGSIRGKLGFDGGAFLPYLTGGLAVAGVDFDGETNTHVGWTLGGGVEFAVAQDVSIDLGYRYSNYGEVDYFGNGDSMDFSTHQVTVGLNWRF